MMSDQETWKPKAAFGSGLSELANSAMAEMTEIPIARYPKTSNVVQIVGLRCCCCVADIRYPPIQTLYYLYPLVKIATATATPATASATLVRRPVSHHHTPPMIQMLVMMALRTLTWHPQSSEEPYCRTASHWPAAH